MVSIEDNDSEIFFKKLILYQLCNCVFNTQKGTHQKLISSKSKINNHHCLRGVGAVLHNHLRSDHMFKGLLAMCS